MIFSNIGATFWYSLSYTTRIFFPNFIVRVKDQKAESFRLAFCELSFYNSFVWSTLSKTGWVGELNKWLFFISIIVIFKKNLFCSILIDPSPVIGVGNPFELVTVPEEEGKISVDDTDSSSFNLCSSDSIVRANVIGENYSPEVFAQPSSSSPSSDYSMESSVPPWLAQVWYIESGN